MKLAELFVDIIGNPRPLYATLGTVRGALQGFGRGLQIPALGMLAGGSAGVMGLGALAAAMGYAVKTAGDLEKAFSQVRKTTGLTGTELAVLRLRIEDMASSMAGVSIDQLLEIATVAGRMGIQGVDDITSFTSAVAKMHIAMDDIPVEELTTNLSRTLNVFKLGPEAALSFGSALNKLDDSAAATGQEILAVTQMLSGAAATMGLSAQKTLALAAALKDAGVHTEVAGTAFSLILRGMATDTAKYAKLAGMSVKDFSAILRDDPLAAIKVTVGALNSLDKLEAPKALDKLGLDGQRTAGSLLQLARTIGKLDTYVAMANSEWETHASIEREVAIQAQTTWAQMQRLGNITKIVANDVGSNFLPVIKELADALSALGIGLHGMTWELPPELRPALQWMREQFNLLKFELQNLSTVWELWGTNVALVCAKIENAHTALIASIKGNAKDLWFYFNQGLPKSLQGIMPEALKPQPVANIAGLPKTRQSDILEEQRLALEAKLLKSLLLGPDIPLEGKPPGKGKPKAEAEGTKKSPFAATEKKSEFLDLTSFAKKLQEGIFGKDKSAELTAKHTQDIAHGVNVLIEQGRKPALGPVPPGVFG